MGLKSALENVFIGKLKEERIDLSKLFFANSIRKDALAFAEKNIHIEGVEEIKNEIGREFSHYAECIRELRRSEEEKEKRKFKTWVVVHIIMLISIAFFAIGSAAAIIDIIFKPEDFWVEFIVDFLKNAVWFLGLMTMPLMIVINYVFVKKSYLSYRDTILGRAQLFCNEFKEKADKLCNEVDSLYLASLEPMHREMVLMRREQERALREQENRHAREMEEMRRTLEQRDAELAKTQKKMLQTQEELLEIEREREGRRSRFY